MSHTDARWGHALVERGSRPELWISAARVGRGTLAGCGLVAREAGIGACRMGRILLGVRFGWSAGIDVGLRWIRSLCVHARREGPRALASRFAGSPLIAVICR